MGDDVKYRYGHQYGSVYFLLVNKNIDPDFELVVNIISMDNVPS